MCGIALIYSRNRTASERENIICRMMKSLYHRGPDYSGFISSGPVTLGHTRLSIIDLSDIARQPMFSSDGKYCIVFNGEIYNYATLRLELERVPAGSGVSAYAFRTRSDTEVVLAAWIRWKEKCLEYLKGMFAFVIYDTEQQSLFIARDRFGVKPLYYYHSAEILALCSEIRPLLRHVPGTFKPDENALKCYLNYQTFFFEDTPVKQIRSLLPGHYIRYTETENEMVCYYNPGKSFSYNKTAPDSLHPSLHEEIRKKVFMAVERRMVSDVPVAAFLSGGIDSSVVVACMAQLSHSPVHTFHVTFNEKKYSEKNVADSVSEKFNTRHETLFIEPREILSQIPDFIGNMDMPSGDGLNTWVISRAVHQKNIRVALAGIGGDEWFMGYPVFRSFHSLLKNKFFFHFIRYFPSFLSGFLFPPSSGMQNARKYDVFKLKPKDEFSLYALSRKLYTAAHFSSKVPYGANYPLIPDNPYEFSENIPLLTRLSLWEWAYYLMPVLLRDADQFSMAHHLEIREPFLDHELVEYVLSLPDEIKIQHPPKSILINAFRSELPESVWNRPKMGFTFPMELWLKKDLMGWAENNMKELHDRGVYSDIPVMDLWKRFLQDDPLVTWTRVWHLIVLNAWMKHNLS